LRELGREVIFAARTRVGANLGEGRTCHGPFGLREAGR